jgi:hypothetical protein
MARGFAMSASQLRILPPSRRLREVAKAPVFGVHSPNLILSLSFHHTSCKVSFYPGWEHGFTARGFGRDLISQGDADLPPRPANLKSYGFPVDSAAGIEVFES